MAVAYAHINSVSANVLDMVGDIGPGAFVWYSAVVINAGNPVINPAIEQYHVLYRQVSINFAAVVTEASIQAQILADIQALWGDTTITGVFI
jgi:hypothetical protein